MSEPLPNPVPVIVSVLPPAAGPLLLARAAPKASSTNTVTARPAKRVNQICHWRMKWFSLEGVREWIEPPVWVEHNAWTLMPARLCPPSASVKPLLALVKVSWLVNNFCHRSEEHTSELQSLRHL